MARPLASRPIGNVPGSSVRLPDVASPGAAAEVLAGPEAGRAARFTLLYRRWLKHGDAVLESLSSSRIAEALADGTGRVESVVLPHSYRHLSPLVDEAPAPLPRVEKGLRRGKREGKRPPHALNPRPQPPRVESELTISEQLERDWDRLNEWYNAWKKLGLTP
jgi:hypothetical protein